MMMRFGGLALIGTVVAIQTKEGIQTKHHGPTKEDFEGVTQELLKWFFGIVHDGDNTWHNLYAMAGMMQNLEEKREHENLHLEVVQQEAQDIDHRGRELDSEYKKLEERSAKLHNREKALRDKFDQLHGDFEGLDKDYGHFHGTVEQWMHDHHKQHIRDILANRLNEMLNFIMTQFPMQHARMNEACNLVEQYVTNFENGATNFEPVMNDEYVSGVLKHDCHMHIQEYSVGHGDHGRKFCVLREHGEWEDNAGGWTWKGNGELTGQKHCDHLAKAQEQFQQATGMMNQK